MISNTEPSPAYVTTNMSDAQLLLEAERFFNDGFKGRLPTKREWHMLRELYVRFKERRKLSSMSLTKQLAAIRAKARRDAGIPEYYRDWKASDMKRVAEYARNGDTIRLIAWRMGRSYASIATVIRKQYLLGNPDYEDRPVWPNVRFYRSLKPFGYYKNNPEHFNHKHY